jgi:hypothetical protein
MTVAFGHKEREFAALHQARQQQRVLGPERGRIKQAHLRPYMLSSNGQSGSIRVSNAAIRLPHLISNRDQP